MSERVLLKDDDEILFRQIHPKLLDEGDPDSSNFMPKPSDQNLLSVDRSSITTASDAYNLYIQGGKESAAVYGVSVVEFRNEDVSCFEDPLVATATILANPAHAVADYSKMGSSAQRKTAKKLKLRAIARNKLYP